MKQVTILLTDGDLGDRELERSWLIEALNAKVVLANCKTEQDVLDQVLRVQPDALITQWAPITKTVIAAATACKIISRVGIGIDMIDTAAAEKVGIIVTNVPHYATEEVATHTIAMALSLWRRLPQLDAELRVGQWNAAAHAPEIGRLSDATVALIGCGQIGSMVARVFQTFGASVIVVDPAITTTEFETVSLAEVARRADIISLHAPLLPSTRHIINREFLDSTKRKPILVNASRGELIDIQAAVDAVNQGRLRGLGLDVFDQEPLPSNHIVFRARNTLISAHAAWCSRNALPDLRRGAIDNVIEALREEI